MIDRSAEAAAILARAARGEMSAAVALMEMLIATEDEVLVAALVRGAAASSPRIAAMDALLGENRAGSARIAAMLRSGVDSPPSGGTEEEGIAFCRKLFDWSVQQSEEASVALYSFGNPAILKAATREIVQQLEAWGSLGAEKDALDVGCGIGRMEEALAPRLGSIHGIDVSEEMIASATRRCAGIPNVALSVCSGRDLALFPDARFDLVLAVDSFPYLVQSGAALVARYVTEARRVLRVGGELVVLNVSYRDDLDADRREMRALAQANDFDLVVAGTTPFAIWNGSAFRLVVRGEVRRG